MFRSLLFAIGIFLLIVGAQTLVVDKWIMSYEAPTGTAEVQNSLANNNSRSLFRTAGYAANRNDNASYYERSNPASKSIRRVYQTQEWMPWSLLAAGGIIVLYTYSSGRHESGS